MNDGTSVLITFEGGDGSGKGTIARMTFDFLKEKGLDVRHFREPGTGEVAEEIREVVLKPREEKVHPMTEMLLYQSSRSQFVREKLAPSLENGCVVVQERFYDATVAYQGYGRGVDIDFIKAVSLQVAEGIKPDITFILDLSPETGMARLNKDEFGGQGDRLEQEALDFHKRVRQGYLEMAEMEDRFVVVDVESKYIDEVFEIVKEKILELLEKK